MRNQRAPGRAAIAAAVAYLAAAVGVGSLCRADEGNISAKLSPNGDVGVAFNDIAQGFFDVFVSIVRPDEWFLVTNQQSSRVVDKSGDTIWNRTSADDETHLWEGCGLSSDCWPGALFAGLLKKEGGPGGTAPTFDASVADIDIDVDSQGLRSDEPAEHHWPPDGSLQEDAIEATEGGGMYVPPSLWSGSFPSSLPTGSAYKILKLNLRTHWAKEDPYEVGDLTFTVTGSGVALYRLSDNSQVTTSIRVPKDGFADEQFAILTNEDFAAPATITASFTWDSNLKGGEDTAIDYVRLDVLSVDLDIDGLDESQEDNPGGIVARQYQTQPVPRKALQLTAHSPAERNVTLTRTNSKVRVFDAPAGGAEVTFNGTDNKFATGTLPKTLYVQGAVGSDSVGDVTLTLTHDSGIWDSVVFTVYYLQSLTPSTWEMLCKGQGKTLAVAANIAPSIPGFDPALVQWECNAGTLPGGGTTGTGLGTTWTQDNNYSSSTEDDVFVRAQCGSNGEWVTIRTTIIDLSSVTVRDKNCTANSVTVDSPTPGNLYLRDSGSGATIEIQMTTTPVLAAAGQKILWKVTGSTANPSSGNFSGSGPYPGNVELTPNPTRDFTVDVGSDKNADGSLDSTEVTRTVKVYVITVLSLTVSEQLRESNSVTNPTGTSLAVAIDPVWDNAAIVLHASWAPESPGVGAHVLWTVAGANAQPSQGSFAQPLDPIVVLTPGSWSAGVRVGVDVNADGALDTAEVSYYITVYLAEATVTPENAGGAVGAVPLTECMVNRTVTFTATVSDCFPGGFGNPMTFTFTYEDPDGTVVTSADWSYDHVEDNDRLIPDFTDTDGDHKYTTPVYVIVTNDGVWVTSKTLNIDVYQLWIKHFKDYQTGKAWKVCIDDWIDYEAYASSDCQSWQWDMEDRVPDAWNPEVAASTSYGRSGTNMYIPNSDKARADNSWFGDTYGTVYVFCEDGDGNNHSFYSTSMDPSQKAKVFFDPDTGVDGQPPSQDNPPAWFVFWRQGNVVEGMSNFQYLHSGMHYGRYQDGVLELGLLACTTNAGPETLYDLQENPFNLRGQGRHLHCVSEIMAHESYHKYCADNFGGAPQSDGDGITDPEETNPHKSYFPVSDPLRTNTFGGEPPAAHTDQEVRCRVEELHGALPEVHVEKDWSADPENPNWVDP